jgi:hypothetical protein
VIWFAPFDGFGDADPLVPFSRPPTPPRPCAAETPPEQPAFGESSAAPPPGDERPPPRASIK